ncbi:LuxR C-terminal-related transcriptional regulator [Plantibacter sp. Mn2098]|uniref:helix-turn-helix transcriptional regulator n=1 Tax=Plantibacter sp. Mn2098 TaxID=3395266 RepID=UPI003BCF66CE
MEWPIVIDESLRDRLVEQIRTKSGRVQLILGPSGIGKSTHAAAIAAALEAEGFTALYVVGMPELRDVPLGALAPLLAATGAPIEEPTDERLQRLFSITAAARGGQVLIVDDGPMLDDVSASALYQLIRVYRIPCVMTVRTEHELAGPLLRLQDEGLVDVVEQTGIDTRAAGDLVQRALGAIVEPSSLKTIVDRAAGNPLFLRELVLAATRTGAVHDGRSGLVIDAAALPDRLRETLALRFRALDAPSRALAELIAVAEPWPEELLPDRALLARLDQTGLIARAADGEVYLAHPLFAETVLSLLSEEERDERRFTAADILRNSTRADHRFVSICLLAETTERLGDVEHTHTVALPTAAELAWAARHAHGLADHALTVKLSAASIERSEQDGEPAVADARLVHADSLSAAGLLDEADVAFARAAEMAENDTVLAHVTVRHGYHLSMRRQHVVGAVRLGMSVVDRMTESRAREFLVSNITNWRLMSGDPAAHATQHIADPDDAASMLDAELYRLTASIFAGDLVTARAAMQAASALTETVGAMKRTSGPILDFGWFLTESLDGRIDESLAFAIRQRGDGLAEAVGMWNYGIALMTLHAGRTQEALDIAARAVGQLSWRDFVGAVGAAKAIHATAAARLGQHTLAAKSLASIEPAARDFAVTRLQIAEAEAWRLMHDGRLPEAVEVIRTAVDRGIAANYYSLSGLTASLAVHFGAAEAVVEPLRTIVDATTSDLMVILLEHAEAAANRDAAALLDAAARLGAAGLHAGAATAAKDAAGIAKALGDERQARRATLLAAEWSRHLSGRDPYPRGAEGDDGSFALTKREWTVASAAAGRQRSKEIAEHLGVSVRTVDNHLRNVYRKLGVSSRDELRRELETLSEPAG